MAEKQTDLRSNLSKGSQEVFELFCEPCFKRHCTLEAVGFCQTCAEYFCQTCYDRHATQSATENHALLDKSAMPKTKVAAKPKTKVATKVIDVITETCPKHTDKLIEYICNVHHGELCCAVCMTLNHAQCQDRSYIPDLSDNVIESGEYKRLQAYLDRLVFMATGHIKMTNTTGQENDGLQSKCLTKIKSLRKQIDQMLNKIQTKAEQNVISLHQENMDKITKNSAECQTIISEMQSMISNLKIKKRDGNKVQLYVDVKLSSQNMSKLEGQLQDMMVWRMIRYEIAENQKLQELESTLSALLSVQQYRPITGARHQQQINVKSVEDREDCLITGIAVLEEGRVVVTDQDNKAVKLIDVKKNKVVSRVSCVSVSFGPLDVTQTEPNKVAVLLNSSDIILFDVSHVLTKIKVIQVANTGIWGICSYQDNILVACRQPSCLKVIDMSGKVVRVIDKDHKGDTLDPSPFHIAVSHDQTVVYATGFNNHTVSTVTMDDKIVSTNNSNKLLWPAGVTVSKRGDVFVCCCGNHTVHQLSSDGQYTRVLLGKEHGLADRPQAIAYNDENDGIYISHGYGSSPYNFIHLYKLE